MHCSRSSILKPMGLRTSLRPIPLLQNENGAFRRRIGIMNLTSANGGDQDQILIRVIEIVKKYYKTNTSKVSTKFDFQKDLSLDSLNRVEIVMAIEEEFSIETHSKAHESWNLTLAFIVLSSMVIS